MVRTSFLIPFCQGRAPDSFRTTCVRASDLRQRSNECGEQLVQLTLVVFGQCSKYPLTLRSNLEHDTASIGGVVCATDQASFLASFAEFDDAMVSQAQSLRRIRYRRFDIVRSTRDVQQE